MIFYKIISSVRTLRSNRSDPDKKKARPRTYSHAQHHSRGGGGGGKHGQEPTLMPSITTRGGKHGQEPTLMPSITARG